MDCPHEFFEVFERFNSAQNRLNGNDSVEGGEAKLENCLMARGKMETDGLSPVWPLCQLQVVDHTSRLDGEAVPLEPLHQPGKQREEPTPPSLMW